MKTDPSISKYLPDIVYEPTIIDGVPMKPDSRAVIERAFAGHPILISSQKDYVNLYHVYDRKNARLPSEEQRLFLRQQIGKNSWRLFIAKSKKELPKVRLEKDYNPRRGRYKRYAEQLAAGARLILHDKAEAIKARRAWQLYTPREERLHLRSAVRHMKGCGRPLFIVETIVRQYQ